MYVCLCVCYCKALRISPKNPEKMHSDYHSSKKHEIKIGEPRDISLVWFMQEKMNEFLVNTLKLNAMSAVS